jgi:endonuclease YncB( thermonuclease family)
LVNGVDANLEQVKHGLAWFYRKYQNEMELDDRLNYLQAEEAAHAAKVGLWSEPDPVAPWDFRHTKN